jgi:hypothetical protein
MKEIRILSATGILGSGLREETLKRAMTLEPDFLGADSGSTHPGPHYLGSAETFFSDSACKRDLRLMLLAGRAARIHVIVGSACTSGSDFPEVVSIIDYDAANAITITITRPTISGDIDDTDVFGRQQHGRLVDIDVP